MAARCADRDDDGDGNACCLRRGRQRPDLSSTGDRRKWRRPAVNGDDSARRFKPARSTACHTEAAPGSNAETQRVSNSKRNSDAATGRETAAANADAYTDLYANADAYTYTYTYTNTNTDTNTDTDTDTDAYTYTGLLRRGQKPRETEHHRKIQRSVAENH